MSRGTVVEVLGEAPRALAGRVGEGPGLGAAPLSRSPRR